MASSSCDSVDEEDELEVLRAQRRQKAWAASQETMPKAVAEAVAKGDSRLLLDWLDTGGGRVDARDSKGRTILMLAAALGHAAIVRQLLRRCADVELKQRQGTTALMFAAYGGDAELTRLLLVAHARVEVADNRGLTAYDYAKLKDRTAVSMLLRHHAGGNGAADGSHPSSTEHSPPHSPQESPASQASRPESPAHAAAGWSWPRSPLASAASSGVVGGGGGGVPGEVAGVAGASLRGSPRGSPRGSLSLLPAALLDAAKVNDVAEVAAYLGGGGDVDAVDPALGGTLLTSAASHGHLELIELLLDHRAQVNCRDASGVTPLAAACVAPWEDAVDLLLSKGADVNQADDAGTTPLMLASCLSGRVPLVRLLLSMGARKEARDASQQTALMHAQAKGHTAVAMLLTRPRLPAEVALRRLSPEELLERTRAADAAAAALLDVLPAAQAHDERKRACLPPRPASLAHVGSAAGLGVGGMGGVSHSSGSPGGGRLRTERRVTVTGKGKRKAKRAVTSPAVLGTTSSSSAGPASPAVLATPAMPPAPAALPGASAATSERASLTLSEGSYGASCDTAGTEPSSRLSSAGHMQTLLEVGEAVLHACKGPSSAACGATHSVATGGESGGEGGGEGGGAPPSVDIPESYCCPITQMLMVDPVVTSDGMTYERLAITEWFARRATSPLTGAPLVNVKLIANTMARSLIREFAEQYPHLPECVELHDRINRERHNTPIAAD